MPAFSFRHIKDLYPVFWAKTRELVLALDSAIAQPNPDEEKSSHAVDVAGWASRATLDIIGEAGMNKSFNAIEDDNSELFQMYRRVFKPSRAARYMQFLGLIMPYGLVSKLPFKRSTMITGKRCADYGNTWLDAMVPV